MFNESDGQFLFIAMPTVVESLYVQPGMRMLQSGLTQLGGRFL